VKTKVTINCFLPELKYNENKTTKVNKARNISFLLYSVKIAISLKIIIVPEKIKLK
jgi:hypothetical protein